MSAGEKVVEMTKEGASKVAETVQAVAEKDKQAARGTWDSAKETVQNVKGSVTAQAQAQGEDVHGEGQDRAGNGPGVAEGPEAGQGEGRRPAVDVAALPRDEFRF
jgi:hypothetical protein